MWKRSLFFVAIFGGFWLGVWGSGNLPAAGPWHTSCSSGNTCPGWNCTYRTAGGVNATCTTCGFKDPTTGLTATCNPSDCGKCQQNYFSICCVQSTDCDGQDMGTAPVFAGCICGIANYPGNAKLAEPFCQRKPSIWALFASW